MKRLLFILLFLPQLCFVKAQQEAETLQKEIQADLQGNILAFWMKHSVDPQGGFYGSLKRDGTPVSTPKGAVLNARLVWTFSSAYRIFGDKRYKELADRAQSYYINYFIDKEYGGVFWELNADGSPRNTNKQTYGCAFGIYGLSEHFRATGNVESLLKAIEIYRTMEEKIVDKEKEGYIETFTREWGTPRRIGYDGSGAATKTMNTHIHVLEAYTSLYRVWKDDGLRARLANLINILTTKMYNEKSHHLHVFCDNDWKSLEDIDSYGHDIETSWLMCEAAEVLDDPIAIEKCEKVAIELVDASLKEGLNKMGAMMYERHGDKFRRESSWWCQAEAVVGCYNAYQITGDKKYLDNAIKFWDFIKDYQIDKEHGEWFRTVLEDGTQDMNEMKGSMWNCPYHNSRMGFEIITRMNTH